MGDGADKPALYEILTIPLCKIYVFYARFYARMLLFIQVGKVNLSEADLNAEFCPSR